MNLLYMSSNIRPAHFLTTALPGAAGTLAILVNITMAAEMRTNGGGSSMFQE